MGLFEKQSKENAHTVVKNKFSAKDSFYTDGEKGKKNPKINK